MTLDGPTPTCPSDPTPGTPAEGRFASTMNFAEQSPLPSDPTDVVPSGAIEPSQVIRIPGFQILDLLGAGGMGQVFLAFDEKLRREVAIKFMKPGCGNDPVRDRRFEIEAVASAALNHPHIVAVHSIGENDGRRYIVMQFIKGESLSARLRRTHHLDAEAVILILSQILEALAAAHEAGLVHRDIKPGNILIESKSGRAYLADFGLASLQRMPSQLTSTGVLIGTPDYMSPEQFEERPADHRSDLYSLGVTAYQALTGRLPFSAGTLAAVAYLHVHQPPPLFVGRNSSLSSQLWTVISRLLEKDPANRYQTAEEALLALRPSHRDREDLSTTETRRLPQQAPPMRRLRRWRGVPMVVVAAAIVILGASANRWPGWSRPNSHLAPIATGASKVSHDAAAGDPRTDDRIAMAEIPDLHFVPGARPFQNSVGMRFVWIPAGDFDMGCPDLDANVSAVYSLPLESIKNEFPKHRVRMAQPLAMSECEVTEGQFEVVMGFLPLPATGSPPARNPESPVAHVTWQNAVDFCERLSENADEKSNGRRYRLPTEAEWEYACRAGEPERFGLPAERELQQVAWFGENSGGAAHPVGRQHPNRFGLFDMRGNLSEWCFDRYDPVYYGNSPLMAPDGPTVGLNRVVRGGAWNSARSELRSSSRGRASPTRREATYGFRVVMDGPTPGRK